MTKPLAKIGVIEDEEVLLKTLAEELVECGFEVVKACDGKDGLAMVERESPDLILLDIVMPKMDGIEMFHKVRTSPGGKNIPVIFLTNKQADDAIIKEISKGEASYYLVKSNYQLGQVVEKVREVLKLD